MNKNKLIVKKRYGISLILILVFSPIYSQIQEIADKILSTKGKVVLGSNEHLKIDTLWKTIKFYRDFEKKESTLNGETKFGFTGNESNTNDLFKINAEVKIDNGIYPFEFDLKANFQTTIQNGKFEENISDIDISYDYHPKIGDGLWLESFIFLSRFNNTYLAINQRYETGGGIILNLFSHRDLTKKGKSNKSKIEVFPEYKLENNKLIECYQNACNNIGNPHKLTSDDLKTLKELRYNYHNANTKQYAKWRLALLIGLYYENEKAKIENEQLFDGELTLFDIDEFDATNKLRWELRPTLVYKPTDVFTFKFYPYIKFPLIKPFDEVRFDEEIVDRRRDIFYDIQASIKAKVNDNISFSVNYRYFKDLAPKRAYRVNSSGTPTLIVGQETNSYYNINFSFKF